MLNDVRYAILKLRQNPGFAFTAIVSIALASGTNTAIFSLLNTNEIFLAEQGGVQLEWCAG
jgi:hypothetical protein